MLDPDNRDKVVWEWDKRKYIAPIHSFKVPPVPMPPPVEEIVSKVRARSPPSESRTLSPACLVALRPLESM